MDGFKGSIDTGNIPSLLAMGNFNRRGRFCMSNTPGFEQGVSLNLGVGSSREMLVQPTAEARKAKGASWVALLTPRPPDHTGRDA